MPLLITWKCVPQVDLLNALLWAGRKGPATYTRYFALGMQLSPALQSPVSFHLGCVYARKKKIFLVPMWTLIMLGWDYLCNKNIRFKSTVTVPGFKVRKEGSFPPKTLTVSLRHRLGLPVQQKHPVQKYCYCPRV